MNQLEVDYFDTTVEKSCERYIGLKLKSSTIAHWIMKTPFFSALFSILPSLGSMILLGHYIKELENDPDLVIVLDSPATGHAKSMIESTYNFKEIFKAGVLVEDIHKMHHFLFSPGSVKSFICSLPTEMSLQEAGELKNFFIDKSFEDTSITLNNFIESEVEEELDFISSKKTSEAEIIQSFEKEHKISFRIPKFFTHDDNEAVNLLTQKLEQVL